MGGSGRISGWVGVQPPPPPGMGWDFVGALGSIEPVPLLSFFCCRFHVTCLFMVCLHGIAYRVCMPHAHKGARMHCHLCQMRRGQHSVKNLVFCIACLSWVRGWVGGWVGVRPPPPPGGGGGICQSVGMPKFWVGGSLNYPPPPVVKQNPAQGTSSGAGGALGSGRLRAATTDSPGAPLADVYTLPQRLRGLRPRPDVARFPPPYTPKAPPDTWHRGSTSAGRPGTAPTGQPGPPAGDS